MEGDNLLRWCDGDSPGRKRRHSRASFGELGTSLATGGGDSPPLHQVIVNIHGESFRLKDKRKAGILYRRYVQQNPSDKMIRRDRRINGLHATSVDPSVVGDRGTGELGDGTAVSAIL
jgi:hypothetical protein